MRVRPTSLRQVEYLAAMEDDHLLYCAHRYSVVRVKLTSLRQVEYLAAMEEDHLLCTQVFCGASEAYQPEAGRIPGCHLEDDHLLCTQVFCGASEADQPEAGGIPGSNGRRSLRVLDRAWSQQV